MPSTTEIVLSGPEGHVHGSRTEWDYDRAGGAYVIRCECDWISSQHWSWPDALEEYDKHIKFTERIAAARALSNDVLVQNLVKLFQHTIGGTYAWGNEWILEAANRLGQ